MEYSNLDSTIFLTDSLRALFIEAHGYEVTPLEYVSPIDTPKNLMIRANKKI
jgi:hypothetical protein